MPSDVDASRGSLFILPNFSNLILCQSTERDHHSTSCIRTCRASSPSTAQANSFHIEKSYTTHMMHSSAQLPTQSQAPIPEESAVHCFLCGQPSESFEPISRVIQRFVNFRFNLCMTTTFARSRRFFNFPNLNHNLV